MRTQSVRREVIEEILERHGCRLDEEGSDESDPDGRVWLLFRDGVLVGTVLLLEAVTRRQIFAIAYKVGIPEDELFNAEQLTILPPGGSDSASPAIQ